MEDTPEDAQAATPQPDTAPAGDAPQAGTDVLIERWWHDNFPGSEVARNTDAWNHAFAAKERLKAMLREGK